jgi:hypothetical protein
MHINYTASGYTGSIPGKIFENPSTIFFQCSLTHQATMLPSAPSDFTRQGVTLEA